MVTVDCFRQGVTYTEVSRQHGNPEKVHTLYLVITITPSISSCADRTKTLGLGMKVTPHGNNLTAETALDRARQPIS